MKLLSYYIGRIEYDILWKIFSLVRSSFSSQLRSFSHPVQKSIAVCEYAALTRRFH